MGLLIDTLGIGKVTVEEEDASPSVSTGTIKLPDRCLAIDHDTATTIHIRAAPK